jgi:putative ABC transport system permease protein
VKRFQVVRRLVRAFLRAGRVWRPALVGGVAATLLMATFVALQSFTLSTVQRTERDLGGYGATMDVGALRTGSARAIESAVQQAGADNGTVVAASLDVALADPTGPQLVYRETAAGLEGFPAPMRLVDGRWPDVPGEVVTTTGVLRYVHDGSLDVLGGQRTLTVVGTIEDPYATGSTAVVAARGTWEWLEWSELTAFADPVLSGQLWWTGATAESVVAEIAALLDAQSFEMYGDLSDPAARAFLVENGVLTREASLSRPALGAVELYPLAFNVPSVLVPVVTALVGLGVNGRRARRSTATLRALGLTARDATVSVVGAGCIAVVLSVTAGVVLGSGAGLVLRPVLGPLSSQPLGPVDGLAEAGTRIVVTTIAALAAGIVVSAARSRVSGLRAAAATLPLARRMPFVRQVGLVLLTVALAWQTAAMSSVFDAVPIVVTTMLMTVLVAPSLVPSAIRRLPTQGAQGVLAKRRLLAEPTRTVLAVSLMALTVGPALATAVLVQSVKVETSAMAAPLVAPGQVLVASSNLDAAPPARVTDIVADVVNNRPVAVRSVGDESVSVAAHESGLGRVIAVDTPHDLAQICGVTLPEEPTTLLLAGGAVDLAEPAAQRRQPLWAAPPGATTMDRIGDLEVRGLQCADAWGQSVALAVLASTAHGLGLPTVDAQKLFTDVPPAAAGEALDAVASAGLDTSYVQVYDGPGDVPLPPEVVITLVSVVVLGSVLVGCTTWARAGTVDRHDRSLRALGLPRSWVRGMLQRESVTVAVAGLLLALGVALVPVALTALRLPGATVVVPWWGIGLLVLVPAALSALATAVAGRRVGNPTSRAVPARQSGRPARISATREATTASRSAPSATRS